MRGEFKILALQAELLAAQLESFTREFDAASDPQGEAGDGWIRVTVTGWT